LNDSGNPSGSGSGPEDLFQRSPREPIEAWTLNPAYAIPAELTPIARRDFHQAVRVYTFNLSIHVERAGHVARSPRDDPEYTSWTVAQAVRTLNTKIALLSDAGLPLEGPSVETWREGDPYPAPSYLTRSAHRAYERAVGEYAFNLGRVIDHAIWRLRRVGDASEYGTEMVAKGVDVWHAKIDLRSEGGPAYESLLHSAAPRRRSRRQRRFSGHDWGRWAILLTPIWTVGVGAMANHLHSWPQRVGLVGFLGVGCVSGFATWMAHRRRKH
jgi:hypothetical protein